ncbi:MAG: bifunctional indole-3-glycerol-phosphate synthase TrpC/phosphoribosylanthranilate isomerase TrpF [Chthoniobacterales bacterium]
MTNESFLAQILARRREDVRELVQAPTTRARSPHRFSSALRRSGTNIIAEFKRASPSLGPIRPDANIEQIVRMYESAGARALSILTEPNFFGGSLEDLRQARAITALPILRKDFIVGLRQIDEAAAAGADAILLIVAALSDNELQRFHAHAGELGLDALIEVHTSDEMERAVSSGAKVIGVNNRDLRSFKTSLETSEQLAQLAPPDAMLVTESGIASRADVERLARCGYRGFLVGESLMRAEDAGASIRRLRGEPLIKICGVTNASDARLCAELGVQMIGLNFSPQSKRCISADDAREVVDAVRPGFPAVKFVGVFVDQELGFVREIARELHLDAVQLHGDESPEYARDVQAPFVIKALRVSDNFSPDAAADYDCDAILLDGYSPSAHGGMGTRFDWSVASAVKAKRLILAGGLTTENIRDAVEMVRPYAVDICSGVEDAPGRKSPEKLRRFIRAIAT